MISGGIKLSKFSLIHSKSETKFGRNPLDCMRTAASNSHVLTDYPNDRRVKHDLIFFGVSVLLKSFGTFLPYKIDLSSRKFN